MAISMELSLAEQLINVIRQIVRNEFHLLHITGKSKTEADIYDLLENKSHETILSKIGWLQGIELLHKLHDLLNEYGLLACPIEYFETHFIGNKIPIEKLKWPSSNIKLVYLLDQLIQYEYVPVHEHRHQLLRKHFVNKNEEELKPGSLKSSLKQIRLAKMEDIEEIIAHLEMLKKKN